jgi:hypothetical protein
MAAATVHTKADVTKGAAAVARRYLQDGGDENLADAPSTAELLRRLGVLLR